jgi:hypothetical protein
MTDEASSRRRMFSIELNSKSQIERISMSNEKGDGFLIEGFLGELQNLGLVEGEMLEITGSNGVLRTDLTESELKKAIMNPNTQLVKYGAEIDADNDQ